MNIDRFVSDRVEVSPRQPVVPTKRVTQLDSLDIGFVDREMRPNALAGIDYSGKLVDLRDKKDHAAPLAQLTVVTMSPWGRFDAMVISTDRQRPPAFHDIEDPVSSSSFKHQSSLTEQMKQRDGVAYWGVNHSAGTLKGEGLQSVLSPHSHVFTFSEAQADLTPQAIKEIRNSQIWDEGVSASLGQAVGKRIQKEVLPLYRSGTVEPDTMGFTIDLPGFSPKDLGDASFIQKLLKPTSLIIHDNLKQLHSAVFSSDLDQVIKYVLSRNDQGSVDWSLYDSFFGRVPIALDAPAHIKKLHDFYDSGELRKPAGWTIGMQFGERGAFAAVSFGVLNLPLGPVESMGVRLMRPSEPVSSQEMNDRLQFYNDCINKQLAA